MSELNSTAASLLGFLHDGPRTGWELVSTAQSTIGPFWSLTRSQVYRELASLADAGLVTAGPLGPRDTRPYQLTAQGREAFSRWASRGPGEATMRLPLLLLVALGRHVEPLVLTRMLEQQRRHQRTLLREYLESRERAVAAGADVFQLAPLDYGIANARATGRWIDTLRAALAAESGSGGTAGLESEAGEAS